MRLLHQVVGLARALFRHEELDSGIADELGFHIERETAANLERGMSPQDAYRAARLKVGSVDGALEIARDAAPGSSSASPEQARQRRREATPSSLCIAAA